MNKLQPLVHACAKRMGLSDQTYYDEEQQVNGTFVNIIAVTDLFRLHMQVGPRQLWKAADHPFRTDKQIQLTGIPTLMKYTDAGLGVRLSSQLETAKTPAEAEAVAKQFILDAAQNSHSVNGHSL